MSDDHTRPHAGRYTIFHFSQANPVGPEPDSVPALLRRVADSVESLGDVTIADLVMNPPYDPEESDPRRSITAYYNVESTQLEPPDDGE